MATLTWRHRHVVRAVVSTVSDFGGANGGNNGGKRVAYQLQLIWRWVQIYGPELDKRCRRHLKPTNKSWRVDETYVNVKDHELFLYRAVDSSGQTIDFLLTAKTRHGGRQAVLSKRVANPGNVMPPVINVDKNQAYPAAVDALKKDGTIRRRCRLRQCKYLNNVVEQIHRNVKRRTWLAKGYGLVATGWRTLRGIEAMDMIRKGREGGEWRRAT